MSLMLWLITMFVFRFHARHGLFEVSLTDPLLRKELSAWLSTRIFVYSLESINFAFAVVCWIWTPWSKSEGALFVVSKVVRSQTPPPPQKKKKKKKKNKKKSPPCKSSSIATSSPIPKKTEPTVLKPCPKLTKVSSIAISLLNRTSAWFY